MTIWSDGTALATATQVLDGWSDVAPALLATAALAAAWLGLLWLLTAVTDARAVRPGRALLELQGPESPAVVNLLATDWDLGHEAVPATLLDLAARRHVEVELAGGRTFVRVRTNPAAPPGDRLRPYDVMVLRHVQRLASQTPDGRVPAEALTTGPDHDARRWWSDFRAAVVADARAGGLSRARWSPGLKAVLVIAAAPVAVAAGLAFGSLSDGDPGPGGWSALVVGALAFSGLSGVAGSRTGERDTPLGRDVAARWLGLRELLEEDPLFAEQPPAGVAIWDRLLAHGAALGVAHGAVRGLPLGAESDRETWSSVGGRWRVVRVRYPGLFLPGYGRHPALAALMGVAHVVPVVPLGAILVVFAALLTDDGGPVAPPPAYDTMSRARPILTTIAAVLVLVAAAAVLRGTAMAVLAVADLVSGREVVGGRILRKRERVGRDDGPNVVTDLVVDDGTAGRVRAWRIYGRAPGERGDTVRASVSRVLRHVDDLQVIERAPTVAPPPVGPPPPVPPPDDAPAAVPPLPDDAAVSAAAGMAFARDPAAPRHPAALAGGSAIYRADALGPDGGHVQLVWMPTATVASFRHRPDAARLELGGIDDESYRARAGGVVARRGAHVVMVTPHLPSLDAPTRDHLAARVAAAALAQLSPAAAPEGTAPVPTPARLGRTPHDR